MAEEIRVDDITSLIGTLGAGATDTEVPVKKLIRQKGYEGYFSVQPIFTGTGTLQMLYQVSNDGVTWSPAVEIVASATSGTVYPYPAAGVNIFAGYQRLVLTETGGVNPVVVTGVHRCSQ